MKTRRPPGYCLHKPTGQAYVRLGGKMHYLGRHGSHESKEEYARLLLEAAVSPSPADSPQLAPCDRLTVVELCSVYLDFAETYYVKGGKPTGQLPVIRRTLSVLREVYGTTAAVDFGPLALRAIQKKLIDEGLARKTINHMTHQVVRVFKWAVSHELLPVTVHQALATVPGLRKGQSAARETAPVLPVADEVVKATLSHLTPVVADMIRFQRATGARPAEVCLLRPCDVDRSGEVWRYVPAEHKTEHHGRQRIVHIGPQAQAILMPYLLRPADAYCFDPREAVQKWLEAKSEARVTPLHRGNRPGTNKRRKPVRQPGERYTVPSYRRAIYRAVDKANREAANEAAKREAAGDDGTYAVLPRWSPNQLRHATATAIRREFGLEAVQTVLGHAHAAVSEIYA